jgi:hypothetical protein
VTVTHRTYQPGEIDARRAELLAQAGLDLETLRERIETWQVSPEQAVIASELEILDWIQEKRRSAGDPVDPLVAF